MADVQIAVGLGRKAGLDDGVAELLRFQIFNDNVADEVRGARLGRRVRVGFVQFRPDEFATLMLLVFYMGRADSRVPAALWLGDSQYSRDNLRREAPQSSVTRRDSLRRLQFSWQIAFNAVVSFQPLPSARRFASGACSMKLRSEARILPIQRVEPAPWMRRQSSSMVVTQAIFGINVAVFVAMLGWRFGLRVRRQIGGTGELISGRHHRRPVVAVADLRLHPRRPAAHRVQYVVLVGSGQTGRISLRPLDIRCGVPDYRVGGKPRELVLESRSPERWRLGGDFWDCRCSRSLRFTWASFRCRAPR